MSAWHYNSKSRLLPNSGASFSPATLTTSNVVFLFRSEFALPSLTQVDVRVRRSNSGKYVIQSVTLFCHGQRVE